MDKFCEKFKDLNLQITNMCIFSYSPQYFRIRVCASMQSFVFISPYLS